MRDIKFRAWTGEKFIYWNMNRPWNRVLTITRDQLSEKIFQGRGTPFQQYTGLKDSKGVEIYEGDIVSDSDDLLREVKYGIQGVDAFEGVGFNLWTFNGVVEGDRLQSEFTVIAHIYEIK